MTYNYYINILNSLIEVLDTYKIFNDDELQELNKTIYTLIIQYMRDNIHDIIDYTFDREIITSVYEIMDMHIREIFSNNTKLYPIVEIKIKSLIKENLIKAYSDYIPPRSYKTSFLRYIKRDAKFIKNINKKIDYLYSIPQPEQRSENWYIFRHKLITASSAWKIFKSNSSRNQLIYEKCEPYTIPGKISPTSSLHWGQKYEPISIQLYEYL